MEKKEKALVIGYIVLLVLGLILFMPIREAVNPPYGLYKDWWALFAVCYTIPIVVAGYVLFFKDGRLARLAVAFFPGSMAFIILAILFHSIQWLFEHVVL